MVISLAHGATWCKDDIRPLITVIHYFIVDSPWSECSTMEIPICHSLGLPTYNSFANKRIMMHLEPSRGVYCINIF